ncbi:MAG: DUF3135 domain-containing protein [Desulfuromonadaceae bacterium]
MNDWRSSAATINPERFELERRLLIEQAIAAFPESFRKRAYGIQFSLDAKLALTKDSISRLKLMIELFWEQFHRFREVLENPEGCLRRRRGERASGELLPLPARRYSSSGSSSSSSVASASSTKSSSINRSRKR